MANRQRAVFAGVARNCAAWLPSVLANLDRLARLYSEAAFVFVLSDTTDGSLSILEEWLAAGRPGKAIDLGDLEPRLALRTERIAFARNVYLDEIRASAWNDYDHLVVVDLDDVLAKPVAIEGYEQARGWLDSAASRAAAFANATPKYYDIWSLRHDTWCPADCWHPIWGRPAAESFEAAKFREIFARQIDIPPHLAPIEVRSAFGGLGLYRMPFTRGARYHGVDGLGRQTSEHVAFNASIGDAGGQLYICPQLQVHAPREHLYAASEFTRRWRLAMLHQRASEWFHPPWQRLFLQR